MNDATTFLLAFGSVSAGTRLLSGLAERKAKSSGRALRTLAAKANKPAASQTEFGECSQRPRFLPLLLS